MKTQLTTLAFATALIAVPASADVYLNELHYDNAGGDVGEFIEISVSDDMLGSLNDISITLYNGNGGATYGIVYNVGADFDAGASFGGWNLFCLEIAGIQNGAPDGLSIDTGGVVDHFLSYEGSFTAVGGVADTLVSTDIGVSEGSGTAIGSSLGLSGLPGTDTWTVFDANAGTGATKGEFNHGQIPAPGALALLGVAGLAGRRRRRA